MHLAVIMGVSDGSKLVRGTVIDILSFQFIFGVQSPVQLHSGGIRIGVEREL